MRITVCPEDRYIRVDGVGLNFDFPSDPLIHAIQWYGDHGTVEYKVGPSEHLSDVSFVQPYIDAWAAEKARLDAIVPDGPPPPPSVPPVVSPFQARAALLQAGLLDDVETYMALPTTDPLEKLSWDRATEFRRGSPSIAAMQALLGVTDEQMDDLFRFASTIYA